MPNVFNVQKAVKQLIWTGMVDNQQIRPRVIAQTCGKRFVGE
jgi:hypothetical protein